MSETTAGSQAPQAQQPPTFQEVIMNLQAYWAK